MSVSLARAWVAAGQGAVSEAITLVRRRPKGLPAKGQFAAEVLCLQTAAQFGDRSGAPRLRELEAIVEGPRVGIAARFAEALHDGDAAELAAVVRGIRADGRPRRRCGCGRPRGYRVSPPGSAGIGIGMLAREQMRWPKNAAAQAPRRPAGQRTVAR